MKDLFGGKLVRLGLPVIVLLGTLLPMELLMTAPSAGATTSPSTTTSVSCTVQTLLLPGQSTTCSTPVENCPSPAEAFDQCELLATTVANAAVGIDVGGKATTIVNGSYSAAGVTTPIGPFTTSASCSNSLALLGGCTGKTAVTDNDAAGSGNFGGLILNASGKGVCVWTGGDVAVLVTLTCTESMAVAVVATD